MCVQVCLLEEEAGDKVYIYSALGTAGFNQYTHCTVCETACTVDSMLSAEAETLNNAARRAGWPLLHLLRQVGRNADDAMC